MSIRSRIGWSFTALAASVLLVLVTVTYHSSKTALTAQILRQLSSVAAIQESRVRGVLERNLERLSLITSRTQLRLSLRAHLDGERDGHLPRMERILGDAAAAMDGIVRLAVVDRQGRPVVAVADGGGAQPDVAARTLDVALRRPLLAGFHRDPAGRIVVRVAGPLVLAGRTLGALVADIHATGILDAAADHTGLGETGETLVAFRDADGTPRYVAPPRFAPDAALAALPEGAASAEGASAGGTASGPVPLRVALEGDERLLDAAVDYRGHTVLAVTRYIEPFGIGLVAKIDRDEAYAPVYGMGILTLALTIAATLAVVVLALLLARSISRPLRSLTDTAIRIAEGERAVRVDGGQGDEVRVLAGAFDRMARHLIELNRSLEDQVARRTEELRESNRALETYTYSVSHDLRAPLRGLRQWADALLEDHGPDLAPEAARYAERIVESAGRMDALISDLLAYSRASADAMPLTPVSLSALVHDVLTNLQPHLREQDAVVLAEEPLPDVVANEAALFQVVSNLVTNAVKFVAPDRRPRVRIHAERRAASVRLWVDDNGIGVPLEARSRIFEPFERLPGADRVGGTGIGLAIVRRSVERMSGTVGVESEPGEGSHFWIELPAPAPVEDAAADSA